MSGSGFNSLYTDPEVFKINNDDFPHLFYPKIAKGHDFEWAPFDWKQDRDGCVVKFEANKFWALVVNGKRITTVSDDIFAYAPRTFDNYKFYTFMKKVTGRSLVCLGFKSILVALHTASMSLKYSGTRVTYGQLACTSWKVTRQYKILKPLIDLLEDEEYNNLVRAKPSSSIDFPVRTYTDAYPSGQCDDDLYKIFNEYLEATIYQPGVESRKWGSKSNCVGSLEVLPGEELLLRTSKRNIDFEYVFQCILKNGFPAVVTRFPKSGCLKTDGTVRSIYPMNILYECFLRDYFGKRKPLIPFKVALGRDFGPAKKFFYDLKNCDEQLLPYLSRFAKEHDMLWLIPLVVDPLGNHPFKGQYSDQFPSGVYHTSIVTVCYTAALCTLLRADDAVIQGDGFMTNRQLRADHRIRTCQDFNGFVPAPGLWRYNRSHNLNEAKFIRGNGPVGIMRYNVLYWAYKQLDAVNMPANAVPPCDLPAEDGIRKCVCGQETWKGLHFNNMTDRERCLYLTERFSDLGHVVKIALNELHAVVPDTRKNNWDTFPLVEVSGVVDEGKNLYPRYSVYTE